MRLCDSTGPAGSVIKYGSFTVLHLIAIKLWQWGKMLGKIWLKSICVYTMPAGRQTSHY